VIIHIDPDATVPVVEFRPCDYHKADPGRPHPGCTCSGSFGLRAATETERQANRRARVEARRLELEAELRGFAGEA
jgi:hypothetical protein